MKKIFLSLAVLLALSSHPAFGANAVATAVSTITVVSTTVTVNSTAHGLAANQGFCLSAPANACGAVVTSSANSFTFTSSSVVACASSCGTVVAAPRVIVLDISQPVQGFENIHFLEWLTTTNGIPISGAVSAWKAAGLSAGASTAQSAAIAGGSFVEVNVTQTYPTTATLADIQGLLQQDYATRQAALIANTQPAAFFGQVYDGTGWGQK